mmetsp:Transcript_4723/g.10628  ORF Transcript_4723/g.10628 Transcript_4723/m.10628 type:complete len:219 (-) Transcript_4723:102-758(-)
MGRAHANRFLGLQHFVRGLPQLCEKMQQHSSRLPAPPPKPEPEKPAGTIAVPPSETEKANCTPPHSFLRVPSLASSRSDGTGEKPDHVAWYQEDRRHPAHSPFGWRMYDQAHFSPARVTCPPPYDARFPFRPLKENYSPQVRSGRGGARMVRHAPTEHVPEKRSLTVSQRGGKSRGVPRTEPSLSARVAVAISRKTKRKLPLARSASVTPVDAENDKS